METEFFEKNEDLTAKIEAIKAKDFPSVIDVDWHGVIIKVKNFLPFGDAVSLTTTVVDGCFADDTEEYLPENKDFTMRCAAIEYYTDISLPDDVSERYDLVYGTDLWRTIVRSVDSDQINEIADAIEKKIEYKKQKNIGAMTADVNRALTSLSDIENSLSALFSGIDNETISKFFGAVANGALDENKLAKAVIEQRRGKASPGIA